MPLLLAALVGTLVLAAVVVHRPRLRGRGYWAWAIASTALLCVSLLAFFPTAALDSYWPLVVFGPALLLALAPGAALVAAVDGDRTGTDLSEGALAAVVTLVSQLYLVGGLVQLRLKITPKVDARFFGASGRDTFWPTAPLLIAPALALTIVCCVGIGVALRRGNRTHGSLADAIGVWTDGRRRSGRRSGGAGRAPGWLTRRWLGVPVWFLVGVGVLGALHGLPMFFPADGGAHLEAAHIATPEFAKILWVPMLAYSAYQLRGELLRLWLPQVGPTGGGIWLAFWRPIGGVWRALWMMILLMLIPVGSAVMRSDWGSALGPLAAVVCIAVLAGVRASDERLALAGVARAAGGSFRVRLRRLRDRWNLLRKGLRRYGVTLGVGAVIVVVVAGYLLVLGRGMEGRIGAWADPWQYRWNPPQSAIATLPPGVDLGASAAKVRGGLPVTFGMESGVDLRRADNAQMARVQTAIALGGLWGRGLSSVLEPTVPVVEADFVLAGIWNKLGAVVVIALISLFVLLWYALVRVPIHRSGDVTRDTADLLRVGVAAMVVVPVLYILGATANLWPHTGLAVPFVSYGPQVTVAMVLLLCLAVAVSFRASASPDDRAGDSPAGLRRAATLPENGRTGGRPAPARPFGRRLVLPVLAAMALLVPFVAGGYLPWRSNLPLSPDAGLRVTETKTVAAAKDTVTVNIAGQPAFQLDPATTVWTPVTTPLPGGLDWPDLTGILRVGPSRAGGLVDSLYQQAALAAARKDIGPLDVTYDLTLDPSLQHTVAALVDRQSGGLRLPTGIVVLDPATGKALAAATSPLDRRQGVAGDTATTVEDVKAVDKQLSGAYYIWQDDGSVRKVTTSLACYQQIDRCVRFRAEQSTAPNPADKTYLASFVGGDTGRSLPDPGISRAVGRSYGVGSTFKLIVSSAHLRAGGSMQDTVAAPVQLDLAPGISIRNVNDGACPGTVGGRITIEQALAVSCNTAFVGLAQQTGWPAIRETAQAYGFSTPQDAPPGNAWPVTSLVPLDADGAAIGNAALGGGDVAATAWEMASVTATIANGGIRVAPSLIDGTGVRGDAGPVRVLDERATRELQQAMATVSQSPVGSLHGVMPNDTPVIHGKTGTQVVGAAAGAQVTRYYWIVGYVDTPAGPRSFAIVAEAPTTQVGRDHVRAITRELVTSLEAR